MKTVHYMRHEYMGDPEPREAPLTVFVYDVPYLDACGIFPPLHVLNQILSRGGDDGGMGPGATWESFTLSPSEYDILLETLDVLDPKSLGDLSRYTETKFMRDPEFDAIQDWMEWMKAVCKKHRSAYKQRKFGKS